jgi:hypothetical protein
MRKDNQRNKVSYTRKDNMSSIKMQEEGLAKLIEIVSAGEWTADSTATRNQVDMYLHGIRDGRIADVVFNAAHLSRMIGSDT